MRWHGPASAAAAVTGLVLAGCGGGTGDTTASAGARTVTGPRRTELVWQRRVDEFAAALVPALRRLERLTGGTSTQVVGSKIDERVFEPGATRRLFVGGVAQLAACRQRLAAAVPPAPTPRLRPVRVALEHTCNALDDVAAVLRAAVLRAHSRSDVDRRVLGAGSRRGQDAVRLVVDALTTMRRVLAAGK